MVESLRLVRVREWEEGPELWPVGSLGESNMMNSLSRKPSGKMFVAQKHDSGGKLDLVSLASSGYSRKCNLKCFSRCS